ncbi:DUF397 domain-containing protein [Plantactinospora sp. CA-294935]|uniref:DUF397 domain-containing protein n=1 Tax=Plantactinospora sp. CA-294935 TaxID=3240012 RepID=UPI003D8E976F
MVRCHPQQVDRPPQPLRHRRRPHHQRTVRRRQPPAPNWRKSTRSGAEGSCVEVAANVPGQVLVRDTKKSRRWHPDVPSRHVAVFPRRGAPAALIAQ